MLVAVVSGLLDSSRHSLSLGVRKCLNMDKGSKGHGHTEGNTDHQQGCVSSAAASSRLPANDHVAKQRVRKHPDGHRRDIVA